jgi:hypothetical protein
MMMMKMKGNIIHRFHTRRYGDAAKRVYGTLPVIFSKCYYPFYRTYDVQWRIRMISHSAIELFRRQSQMQSCSDLFRTGALNVGYPYREPRRKLKL